MRRSFSPLSLNSPAGFGLLEVLISAGILALVVGAAVALGSSSLRTSVASANRTTAYQLAQEGIELVRQIRDTSAVDQVVNTWNSAFPASCVGSTAACALTPGVTPGSWQLISGGGGGFDLATGQTTTRFTRTIRIEPVDWYTQATTEVPSNPSTGDLTDDLILKVTSSVVWNERGRPLTAESQTFLSDWRPVQ